MVVMEYDFEKNMEHVIDKCDKTLWIVISHNNIGENILQSTINDVNGDIFERSNMWKEKSSSG